MLDPPTGKLHQLEEIKALRVVYIDLGELIDVSVSNFIPLSGATTGYDSQWSQYIVIVSSPAWQVHIK